VAENVLYASWLGKVTNPYFHHQIVFGFSYHWMVSKLARMRLGVRKARPISQA
jgi:hypothetical protein